MITARDAKQIAEANASGKPTVVFIHGLWLLPSSWDAWRTFFEEAGYATAALSWPGDADTVAAARANPGSLAGRSIGDILDHLDEAVRTITVKPAIVGHSFGGLLTQMLAGRGLASVSVAIDPAPFRGVLPLPISALRSAMPVLRNPLNRGRTVLLTQGQFNYGWANALGADEAKRLYDEYHAPGPGKPIFQAALANINPRTQVKADTRNPERGALLIIEGDKDRTVPWSLANAAFVRQRRNNSPTEMRKIAERGHSLTIDSGWRDVAEIALDFIKRFLPTA